MPKRDPILPLAWGGAGACLVWLADRSLEVAGGVVLIALVGLELLERADWWRSSTPLTPADDVGLLEQTEPAQRGWLLLPIGLGAATVLTCALAPRPLATETLETAGWLLGATAIATRTARFGCYTVAAGEDWVELRRAGRKRRWRFDGLTGVGRGRALDQVRVTRLTFDDGSRLALRGVGSLRLGLFAPDDVGYRIARRAARALARQGRARLEADEAITLGPSALSRLSVWGTRAAGLLLVLAAVATMVGALLIAFGDAIGVPSEAALLVTLAITLALLLVRARSRPGHALSRRLEIRLDGVFPAAEQPSLQPIRWDELDSMTARGMLLCFAASDGRELTCSGDHPDVPMVTELVSQLAPHCARVGLVR